VNTAAPMPDFQEYAAGAGYLNAKAAVDTALKIKRIRAYRDPRTGKTEQVYDLTETWTGTVGASAPGVEAHDSRTVEVQPGTLSLEITLDWSIYANDLNLYLYDPQGNLAAASEIPNGVYQSASERVHVTAPIAGIWTVKVSGFLNAPQAYQAASNAVVLVNP
jgi:hypothetical protein